MSFQVITNQQELDQALSEGVQSIFVRVPAGTRLVVSGYRHQPFIQVQGAGVHLDVHGSARVAVYKDSTARASDTASLLLYDRAVGTCQDDATGTASDSATLYLEGRSSGTVRSYGIGHCADRSTLLALQYATVFAHDSSVVTARDHARVAATDQAVVLGNDSAIVMVKQPQNLRLLSQAVQQREWQLSEFSTAGNRAS